MDERLRFVARLLEGERTTPLCREFGISQRETPNGVADVPLNQRNSARSVPVPSARTKQGANMMTGFLDRDFVQYRPIASVECESLSYVQSNVCPNRTDLR